jgi:hypothetical protein
MSDDHRMLRDRGIEIGARQGARRLAVIVEIALHPASGRRLGCARTQRRENFLDRRLVAGHFFELFQAAGPRVRVRIIEARQHPPALKIDTPRFLSGERQYLRSIGNAAKVLIRSRRVLDTKVSSLMGALMLLPMTVLEYAAK